LLIIWPIWFLFCCIFVWDMLPKISSISYQILSKPQCCQQTAASPINSLLIHTTISY
jgi:ABC-type nitrate/sulfonate/bicarbonate transport system permease component